MNKSLLLAVGSVLTLAACSGASASVPTDEAPSPVASQVGSATPPAAPSAPPPATTTTTAPPADPPLAKHCNIASATGDVCFESAQGHAGDIVEIEVVLLGDGGCSMVNEASAQLTFDFSKFVLQNVADVQDCRTRRIGPDLNNADVLFWSAFGEHVVSGCTDLPIGKADTIKVKIAAGTPPGDYDISLSNADYIPAAGSPSVCGWHGGGVTGMIRVLP